MAVIGVGDKRQIKTLCECGPVPPECEGVDDRASGGERLENAAATAATGVDLSVGSIMHSTPSFGVSLEIEAG